MDLSTQPTLTRCWVRDIRDVWSVRDESGASAARSWWDDRWERGRQPRPRWCWTSSASAAAERTRGLFGRLVNWAGISASGPVCSARRPVCSPRKVGSGTTWCQARADPGPMPFIRRQSPSGRLNGLEGSAADIGPSGPPAAASLLHRLLADLHELLELLLGEKCPYANGRLHIELSCLAHHC